MNVLLALIIVIRMLTAQIPMAPSRVLVILVTLAMELLAQVDVVFIHLIL